MVCWTEIKPISRSLDVITLRKISRTIQEQNIGFYGNQIPKVKYIKVYTMYLKHKTCNTKIFIELKNSRKF